MPPEARVFVIEDNADWLCTLEDLLALRGHSIIGSARTYEEALGAISTFGILKPDVVTVDGNLTRGYMDGQEGAALIEAIKEEDSGALIVGLSADDLPGVDIDIGKSTAMAEKLWEVVIDAPKNI